jgi:transcription termination/antitermination protein NusG
MNDDQTKNQDDLSKDQGSSSEPDSLVQNEEPAELPPPTDMQIEEHEEEGKFAPTVVEPQESETVQVETNDQPVEQVEEPTQKQTSEETAEQAIENEAQDREEAEASQALDPEMPMKEVAEKLTDTSASSAAKWYIVHTYSGHENKVAKSLRQRVESMGFEERIFDIIVPTRDTIKVSQGKKESVKEKIFPGYVLVKMILDDESWLLVRTTQGVTAFIGAGNKPTPISEKEVEAIQKFMEAEEPMFTTTFTIGEAVKIVDGPFTDFLGTVDNIDEQRGKVKVLVSIFGRETPVELDFLQVSKL